MTNIILNGCNGRMGKFVTESIKSKEDMTIVAGIDINKEASSGFPVYSSFEEITENADVVIDFSNPSAFDSLLNFCIAKKIALVECTTGLSEEQILKIKESSQIIPIFFSANMSLGVNLLVELAKTAAKVLGNNYDIEVVEMHHNQKLDAPSGTALMIADAIKDSLDFDAEYVYDRHSVRKKREHKEIGIHSLRGGTVTGEHEVIFAGDNEIIKLSHSAGSRSLFAAGAVNAAAFIATKTPGLYSMSDMVK